MTMSNLAPRTGFGCTVTPGPEKDVAAGASGVSSLSIAIELLRRLVVPVRTTSSSRWQLIGSMPVDAVEAGPSLSSGPPVARIVWQTLYFDVALGSPRHHAGHLEIDLSFRRHHVGHEKQGCRTTCLVVRAAARDRARLLSRHVEHSVAPERSSGNACSARIDSPGAPGRRSRRRTARSRPSRSMIFSLARSMSRSKPAASEDHIVTGTMNSWNMTFPLQLIYATILG